MDRTPGDRGFLVAASRPTPELGALLAPADARRETEELLRLHPVLYSDAHLVRVALQGMAAYQLPWWDAHMWAHAEVHSLDTLYSEDFQHGRWHGAVRVVSPFIGARATSFRSSTPSAMDNERPCAARSCRRRRQLQVFGGQEA